MTTARNPVVLHTLLAMVCLAVVHFLLPEGTALWRRLFAGIFSVGLGFQLGRALKEPVPNAAARITLWLEAVAFPLLIQAFLWLPEGRGWVLFAAGFLWRHLLRLLWKRPS